MILGENGEKMSKSRGNVVNPDEVVENFGADTLRTYEMFIGAFDQTTPWSENGVKGCHKFLERVWNLMPMLCDGDEYSPELEGAMHKTVKKVTEDTEKMKFNTAIAAMMSLINDVYKLGKINRAELRTFLLLLNPTAPHITEEMWQLAGFEGYLHDAAWPAYDEAKTKDESIEIVLQANGKIRGKMVVPAGLSCEELEKIAMESPEAKEITNGKQVLKVIAVPDKLINIVVR